MVNTVVLMWQPIECLHSVEDKTNHHCNRQRALSCEFLSHATRNGEIFGCDLTPLYTNCLTLLPRNKF